MADVYEVIDHIELAPEPPPRGPVVWARENLFSSAFNGILTVVAVAVIVLFFRAMLGFIFNEGRQWEAATTNARLLMVQAYPLEQFIRVWIAVGAVVSLAAMSFAVFRGGGLTSVSKVARGLYGAGGFLVFLEVLGPFSTTARVIGLAVAVVLIGGGWVAHRLAGERSKNEVIPTMGVVAAIAAIVVGLLWILKLPVPVAGAEDGVTELRGLASTTTVPITVLVAVGVVAYFAGKLLLQLLPERGLRGIIVGLWVASFPVLVLALLRDPAFDYGRIGGTFLPLGAGFALLGGVVIWFLAGPRVGEGGRGIAALLVLAAIAAWFVAALMVVRFLLIVLALFALGAPTFGGEGKARTRYVWAWVITAAVVTFLGVLGEAGSTVDVPGTSFLGGLMLTFVLAIAGIGLSFPIGVMLALGRTSTMPIFRLLSVGYIEIIRGVPLITWLIVGTVILPVFFPPDVNVDGLVRVIVAIALFSGAYLAENVRGGLQSIPKGQYEAARAVGMTTVHMTAFIVLPQALRAVIPALVGQVIALFKDTSLVTIVGIFDLLHIARSVVPTQTQPFNFLGSTREMLLVAAVVYWVFTFNVSRASLRLEKKLGVGER